MIFKLQMIMVFSFNKITNSIQDKLPIFYSPFYVKVYAMTNSLYEWGPALEKLSRGPN